jgi:molybdate transport system substrate-binding protein
VKWRRLAIAALVWFIAAAVAMGPPRLWAAGEAPQQPIVVFAAASTTNAIGQIKRQFTEATGQPVQAGYGSSAALAQQIVNSAGADVFLSADVAWADYLAQRGLVARRRNLLANRLVVVVSRDSVLKVEKPEDLLAEGIRHLALGDPRSVPAGKYARQALEKLGLWERLRPKVAAAGDVRGALAYVETGAAEAAVVYATDAAVSKKVKVALAIPPKLSDPIRYPLVLLKQAEGHSGAKSFYRFLCEPEAGKVFGRYGFILLPPEERRGPRP